MDLESAAEKLKAGVQKATVMDKYDHRISDPGTSQRYASGMRAFLGHDIPETVQAYVDSIPLMTTHWNIRPTDAKKWIGAMQKIK